MATEEYSIGYEDGKSAGFDECMAQQRTWIGLTDGEVAEIYMSNTDKPLPAKWDFAKAIEAKLKEKNT